MDKTELLHALAELRGRLEQLESEVAEIPEHEPLLPCPFCGGEAIADEYEQTGKCIVWCPDCFSRTNTVQTKQEAAALWNRRYIQNTSV